MKEVLQNLELNSRAFVIYKFLNSLFLGVSIGSVFTIYEPLDPSVFSGGGIVLALAMIVIAKFYRKILNAYYFFRISILVELVVLVMIIAFLLLSFNTTLALCVYIGYQLTFIFGSYLVRAETLVLKEGSLLTKVDMSKQLGYLIGMLVSYIFYKIIENKFLITETFDQVYYIHFVLLFIELSVLFFLIKSFKKA